MEERNGKLKALHTHLAVGEVRSQQRQYTTRSEEELLYEFKESRLKRGQSPQPD